MDKVGVATNEDIARSNLYFQNSWNKRTKKFDVEPLNKWSLKPSVKIETSSKYKVAKASVEGPSGYVSFTVAISGTERLLTGGSDDDSSDLDDMYNYLDNSMQV